MIFVGKTEQIDQQEYEVDADNEGEARHEITILWLEDNYPHIIDLKPKLEEKEA